MPTFQFSDWPVALPTDLRILMRQEDETSEFRLVYSISMAAFTQVRLEHIERLKSEGVPEVTSIDKG